MDIYVASSWRNELQPKVIEALKNEGYSVYDFRNPEPGNTGFRWSAIDDNWQSWTTEEFRHSLNHPIAKKGFSLVMKALRECKLCVLILPFGRSAHLEAGYIIGQGKPLIILLQDAEPELMYKMTPFICLDIEEVLDCVKHCLPYKEGEYQKIQRFCNVCGMETEHDHKESISEDVRTTIDVCCECGNADVDCDSIDNDFYFDDDYGASEFDCTPMYDEDDEPRCRVCGCTQNNACPGGCYWVDNDLCSSCNL